MPRIVLTGTAVVVGPASLQIARTLVVRVPGPVIEIVSSGPVQIRLVADWKDERWEMDPDSPAHINASASVSVAHDTDASGRRNGACSAAGARESTGESSGENNLHAGAPGRSTASQDSPGPVPVPVRQDTHPGSSQATNSSSRAFARLAAAGGSPATGPAPAAGPKPGAPAGQRTGTQPERLAQPDAF